MTEDQFKVTEMLKLKFVEYLFHNRKQMQQLETKLRIVRKGH